MFARYGVPEYWIVDPDVETIEVHVLGGDGYQMARMAAATDDLDSAVARGLRFAAGSVFPTKG